MTCLINVKNIAPKVAVIDIGGILGVDEKSQFDDGGSKSSTFDTFFPKIKQLKADGVERLFVNIRSLGGSVQDALLIHDSLKESGMDIHTRCYGYTASAATIIAQAASIGRRYISSNALYLIHMSSAATEDNSIGMLQTIEMLDKTNARISEIYAQRSGVPTDKFAKLMGENNGNGRWLSPNEAIEYGLADKIIAPGDISNHTNNLTLPKNNQNQIKMKMNEFIKTLKNAFTELGEVLNYVLVATDGTELTVDRTEGDPEVGDTASPDGVFIMESGVQYTVVDGVITDISDVETKSDPADDVEALKNEINELKARQTPENLAAIDFVAKAGGIETLRKIASNYVPKSRESMQTSKSESSIADKAAAARKEAAERKPKI